MYQLLLLDYGHDQIAQASKDASKFGWPNEIQSGDPNKDVCEFYFNLNQNKQTKVLLSSRPSVSLSKDWQKSYALTLLCKVNSW